MLELCLVARHESISRSTNTMNQNVFHPCLFATHPCTGRGSRKDDGLMPGVCVYADVHHFHPISLRKTRPSRCDTKVRHDGNYRRGIGSAFCERQRSCVCNTWCFKPQLLGVAWTDIISCPVRYKALPCTGNEAHDTGQNSMDGPERRQFYASQRCLSEPYAELRVIMSI